MKRTQMRRGMIKKAKEKEKRVKECYCHCYYYHVIFQEGVYKKK
jgi:hypothetical protein